MENKAAVVHPAPDRSETRPAPTSELGPAPSLAAIAGHPVHPMLIPFPIAFLFMVPVTDIVFAATAAMFWATVSYYLLWAGLISAGLAAIFGIIDFVGVPRVRDVRAGWAHMLLNGAIVALSVANLLLRMGDVVELVLPTGLILSLVSAGLLIASGWYGGELVYRHKVGISP